MTKLISGQPSTSHSSLKRNILIVGSGGREHTLAWKCLQSADAKKVFVAPGNGGTSQLSVPISFTDNASLADFAEKNECFTIVGPEIPLAMGIVDYFSKRGLSIFGPSREQATLETSKSYAKSFMRVNRIPTGDFKVFTDADEAIAFARGLGGRVAVKADGLAAGKGVFVCSNERESEKAVRALLQLNTLGEAGRKIVVEEILEGREISLMSICNGKTAIPFGTATDHKRLLDGDKGPNTGGMGAYSPSLDFGEEEVEEIMDKVILPTVHKTGFRGFLFAGLILTKEGPRVLEFNARLGDPETQAIIPRLDSDLLRTILIAFGDAEGTLSDLNLRWSKQFSCAVAMCASGYPGEVRTGDTILGLEGAAKNTGALIFHSGTKKLADYTLVTSGGRVLYVTSLGASLASATFGAYKAVKQISWSGEYHRKDIGGSHEKQSRVSEG
ncbi:MAG: phosphoribosylamine--glycine ligase [Nitrososphaerales archaeon]